MAEKFVTPGPLPTPREREILDIVQEECAEIIQRCAKAKRFGLDEIQPGQDQTNRARIVGEVGDLYGILRLADDEGVLFYPDYSRIKAKLDKLKVYMQTEPERAEKTDDPA